MSSSMSLEWLSSYFESGYLFVLLAIGLQIAYAFVTDDAARQRVARYSPPGPRGIPIFGYFPFLGKDPYKTLGNLGEKYGDVVMVTIGNQKMVILNGADVLKQAFVMQSDAFAFRPKALHNTQLAFDSSGLYWESGEKYKELRSFVLSTMKEFGVGTITSETWLNNQCELAADRIASFGGASFDTTKFATHMSIRFMLSFLTGHNNDADDPRFARICRLMVCLESFVERFHAIDVMPWFRFFPDWFNGIRQLRKDKKEFYDILAEIIDEHERTFDERVLRDFIDAFLLKKNQRRDQRQGSAQLKEDVFNSKQLASTITVLLMAGYNTSAHILRTLFEALATQPEVQRKIREEVDNVIGFDRSPSFLDKRNMPYTEATILEAQRYANPLPFGTVRSNPELVTVAGYEIPKNSLVIGNYGKLHTSAEYWANPNEFSPDNFLDVNGKVVHPEHFMPFGAGKRICPGQYLAKMELFLFLATVIQQFTFEQDKKSNDGTRKRNYITYDMVPFYVTATTRVRFY